MDGFYLDVYEFLDVSKVSCIRCSYKCKTCSSGTDCIEDHPDKSKYESTNSGKGKCKQGFYEVNNTCKVCGSSGCYDCNDMGVCFTCKPGYQLINNTHFSNLPYCEACPYWTTCASDSVKGGEDICGVKAYIN